MPLDILVVDDERDIRDLVAGVLEDEGYGARVAADSDSALEAISVRRPSLVLLDVWLQARGSTASSCLMRSSGATRRSRC